MDNCGFDLDLDLLDDKDFWQMRQLCEYDRQFDMFNTEPVPADRRQQNVDARQLDYSPLACSGFEDYSLVFDSAPVTSPLTSLPCGDAAVMQSDAGPRCSTSSAASPSVDPADSAVPGYCCADDDADETKPVRRGRKRLPATVHAVFIPCHVA